MTRITADWISGKQAQALCKALTDAGFQAYFVGGCVRNALLGEPISDIDLATDARPEKVTELSTQARFKPVPTGFDHGTITVVVSGHAFEVTTFRRDVATDGRRATVAYAGTLEEDAHRRDFTMNALFAAPDGTVIDPLGGLDDLKARHVRFIDDPADRIREDYLRILRFFRFHAWYGDPAGGLNQDGLAAIAENLDGLAALSHERVGQEVLKLLRAPNPAPSLAAMETTGVLARVLPGATARAIPGLVHLEETVSAPPDALRRLACLGGDDHQERFRLSRNDTRRLDTLLQALRGGEPVSVQAYRHGTGTALDSVLISSALLETHLPQNLANDLKHGAASEFPVTAGDLMPGLQGRALGDRLREIENRWIASGFALTREELL